MTFEHYSNKDHGRVVERGEDVRLSISLSFCSSNSTLQDLQCLVNSCRLLVLTVQRQPLADKTSKLPRIVALAIVVAVELVTELFRGGLEDVGFAVVLQHLVRVISDLLRCRIRLHEAHTGVLPKSTWGRFPLLMQSRSSSTTSLVRFSCMA